MSQLDNARLVSCFSQMIYLVLLASFESGPQLALDKLAAVCDIAGIKISTFKL